MPINHFSRSPGTNECAFTILELMVAIFIFAIVISTIFGSFQFVFSSTETLQTKTELNEMALNCLNRMRSDLHSFYISTPPWYKPPEFNQDPDIFNIVGDVSDVMGQEFGRIRFTSMAHIAFRNDLRKGIAQIIYYVDLNDNDEIVIRRQDNLYPYPEGFEKNEADPVLCENIRGLTFTYYDHENEEQERWDSEGDEYGFSSPTGIKIILAVGDDQSETILHTRVALPMVRKPAEE